MVPAEAKFARLRGRFSFFAEVAIETDAAASPSAVDFRCSGRGFYSQGYDEDVPEFGYDDWKAGAVAGVMFALRIAGAHGTRVTITRISGLSTDTNPSIVGAAAALAVWRALNFEPSADVITRVENVAFGSWQRPLDEVPQFAESGSVAGGDGA